jgi:hypothetical protein
MVGTTRVFEISKMFKGGKMPVTATPAIINRFCGREKGVVVYNQRIISLRF